jgi:hypothetical protein
MKYQLIIFFLMIAFPSIGQQGFSKEIIKKFSLHYYSYDQTNKLSYSIDMNAHGKTIMILERGGKLFGRKVIKIDKNTFNQFKATIINVIFVYTLPDTINCDTCQNKTSETLKIKSSFGLKLIIGKNAYDFNKGFKSIVDCLFDLVGDFIGDDMNYDGDKFYGS